jgi:hypothetical protein
VRRREEEVAVEEGSHFKEGAQSRAGQRTGQDRKGQNRTGQVQRGAEKKGDYLLVALPLLYNMSSLRGFWASADFLQ